MMSPAGFGSWAPVLVPPVWFEALVRFGSGPLGPVPQVSFARMVGKSGSVSIAENELLLVLGPFSKKF